ncbi:transmembrane amino acid transporter protein-domain-containing protein [Fusarium redolens]|uniref:Transmembrane amino acid transporter protein-domain-containing protein n=1 Tax=Fusarium redolens TaxID=48865 RepID=A0A9P9JK11_FUSRE|nr:transmembrane amino acid transporter protein-domain-containing protein [Fusarium redolens]KAH7203127.1 transmembrane amino acid transporter protein-domain-containing protein [Fusarium redolens]
MSRPEGKNGLGVLSIPGVHNTLGIIPGIICICAISAITTWSNYVIGQFKLKHRNVYGIDDAGGLMFGRIGREVFGAGICIYWVFCSGSGMLSTSIGLNAVSLHNACTAVFVVVAAIASFGLASIRTLGMTWVAWTGLVSVFIAVLMVTIAVGIQDRPSSAPQTGPWESDFKLLGRPSFTKAISAVSSIVFAFAGTPGFFPIAAEMRDPRYYTRALLICQSIVTATYISVGTVVYYYCGSFVASPALGSAGVLVKRLAYGIALPGLIISTIVVIHFPSKYLFVCILRGSKHLTSNSLIHWGTWLGSTFSVTVVAYLVASGIPIFNGLVSLIGALLATLMSFQPMGCMWLYDNWSAGRHAPTLKWCLMVCWSIFVIISGIFLMIAGTYRSIAGIIQINKESGGSSAWSCADNSNSS